METEMKNKRDWSRIVVDTYLLFLMFGIPAIIIIGREIQVYMEKQ